MHYFLLPQPTMHSLAWDSTSMILTTPPTSVKLRLQCNLLSHLANGAFLAVPLFTHSETEVNVSLLVEFLQHVLNRDHDCTAVEGTVSHLPGRHL